MRSLKIYFSFACLLLLAGCSSRTRIIYNDDYKIENHRFFAAKGLRIEPTFGSANSDYLQEQQLLTNVINSMRARGYEENSTSPDFLVTVRVTATENTNLLGGDVAYIKKRDRDFVSPEPRAKSFQSDSLVLEITQGAYKGPSIIGLCNIRPPETLPPSRHLPVSNPLLRLDELTECADEIIGKLEKSNSES